MGFNNKKNFSFEISGGVSRIDIKKHYQDTYVKKKYDDLRALNIGNTKKRNDNDRKKQKD